MLKKALKIFVFSTSLISASVLANIDEVPLPANSEVRTILNDEYPMVLNAFVKMPIEDVMAFYKERLGEPKQITQDIERYTYFYNYGGYQLKVAFYQQSEWCEISLLLKE
jgi:hypothetical protein